MDYVSIEVCENCIDHQWNTFHKQEKYDSFYLGSKSHPPLNPYPSIVQSEINKHHPDLIVVKNQV